VLLRDGKGTIVSDTGQPLLTDAKSRTWFLDAGHRLIRVRDKDGSAAISLEGLMNSTRIAESLDGRIWVLSKRGLAQLETSGAGAKLAIRNAGIWQGLPVNINFAPSFCDSDGGMWISVLGGGNDKLWRVQFPGAPAHP